MSDKSHVTMEFKRCITCGNEYSTGNVLLDTKLRQVFERETVTGWGLCDAHLKAAEEGYLALVEIDTTKSIIKADGKSNHDDAHRTGRVVLMKRGQFNEILNEPIGERVPAVYVDQEAFNKVFPPEVIDNAPAEPDRSTFDSHTAGSKSIN